MHRVRTIDATTIARPANGGRIALSLSLDILLLSRP